MLYRHTRRFQALLRSAALIAAGRELSLVRMIEAARLKCKKSSLGRFWGAKRLDRFLTGPDSPEAFEVVDNLKGGFLNRRDSQSLWDYLSREDYIERALDQRGLKKHALYGLREVANAMHCFYDADDAEQDAFAASGLVGKFVCYKRSFRPGFMVKSQFEILRIHREFFEVNERQRSSGRFSNDMTSAVETTEGFGFLKSGQLWIFGREKEHDQPRIFCFDTPRRSVIDNEGVEKLVGFRGHVMEGTLKAEHGRFFSSRALLYTVEHDKRIWDDAHKSDGMPYNVGEQFDIIPYSEDSLKDYGHLTDVRVPKSVANYFGHTLSDLI